MAMELSTETSEVTQAKRHIFATQPNYLHLPNGQQLKSQHQSRMHYLSLSHETSLTKGISFQIQGCIYGQQNYCGFSS